MKFSVPVAIATFVAVASAAKDCEALKEKIPDCATPCVNAAAAKYCKPGELDCSCKDSTLEKIIEDSAVCVSNVCKGKGPVFPPLRDWCECQVGPSPCAAEEGQIPGCAIACFNEQALKLCDVGEVECGCKPDNLEKIVKGSKTCIAEKCKNNEPPAVPPFRNFCKCINGDDGTTTTTTSAKPTKTSTTSSKPTDTTKTSKTTTSKPTDTTKTSETTSSKPTPTSKTSSATSSKPHSSTTTGSTNSTTSHTSKTETATSRPVTITTTIITTTVCPITTCAPTATGCTTGDMTTETVTFTSTYCPPETETETETETDVVPCPTESLPGTGVPPYPTHPTGTDAPGVPTVSHVPSGSAVQPHPPAITSSAGQPQPPVVTGAAASAQRNSGAVAGMIAAAVGFAWL